MKLMSCSILAFGIGFVIKSAGFAPVSTLFVANQPDLEASCICVLEGLVRGDEAPVSGVAQVVSHGVKVVGVHGEEGQEKDEEVRVEAKGEVEKNQGQPLMCMA